MRILNGTYVLGRSQTGLDLLTAATVCDCVDGVLLCWSSVGRRLFASLDATSHAPAMLPGPDPPSYPTCPQLMITYSAALPPLNLLRRPGGGTKVE